MHSLYCLFLVAISAISASVVFATVFNVDREKSVMHEAGFALFASINERKWREWRYISLSLWRGGLSAFFEMVETLHPRELK